MKYFINVSLLFLLLIGKAYAGDTIRVMHYNLLYYDKNTSWCSSTNNNVDQKDGYLRTITDYYNPDIFTVNEMNGSPTSVTRLLNNVFNINGADHYKAANYTGSYIVNMLYYNSNKLALKSQSYVLTSPRITDVYKLYYKSDDLALGDTTYITCIVTHLKAGNSGEDAAERAQAAEQIMAYINNRNLQGNILFMGDFNVYTSYENAFQSFLTPTYTGFQFYDPVNALGDWQDSYMYAQYHTQSTHSSSSNSCPSSGGMDDRFDFILTSDDLLAGNQRVQYIEDSYWAFGQDGNRLNQSLTDPPNYSLPSNVLSALYSMSDHLPVVMELYIDIEDSANIIEQTFDNTIRVSNPVNSYLQIWNDGPADKYVTLKIMDAVGNVIDEKNINLLSGNSYMHKVNNLSPGIYLLSLRGQGITHISKIVKQ